MNEHQTVQIISSSQTKELAGTLIQSIPADLPAADAEYFLGRKRRLINPVGKILRRTANAPDKPDLGLNIGKVTKEELAACSVDDLVRLQEFYYEQALGLYVRFPDKLIPDGPPEFGWPVCMLGSLTAEDAFKGGTLNPPRWKWTEKPLDSELDLSRGRDAWRRSYVVLIRANWEADDDLKNISGTDMDKMKTDVLMFRERLHIGDFLLWLTGEHLDRETVTLTGSRCSGGDVAGVYFGPSGGEVSADRWSPSRSSGSLRFRQAVSLAEGE